VYALLVNHFMRVYDFEAAQRVDWFIANSKEVQRRIKKFYRRDSIVIYPPVNVEKFSGPVSRIPPASARSSQKSISDQKKTVELRAVGSPSSTATRKFNGGYFLVVSRLVGAKNVDIAVEVCRNLKLALKVVGTGREMENLKVVAGDKSNIEFLGDVDDSELIDLYQNCRALIFCGSQEDFGIVPVEAMAVGKPVIALAQGGVKETVIDGKTGLMVEDLAAGAFVIAINKFLEMEKKGQWDSQFIRKHAEKFGKERFKKEILKFVKEKVK
jgi:glycosyltransferase involved in cell wall biosynthesis